MFLKNNILLNLLNICIDKIIIISIYVIIHGSFTSCGNNNLKTDENESVKKQEVLSKDFICPPLSSDSAFYEGKIVGYQKIYMDDLTEVLESSMFEPVILDSLSTYFESENLSIEMATVDNSVPDPWAKYKKLIWVKTAEFGSTAINLIHASSQTDMSSPFIVCGLKDFHIEDTQDRDSNFIAIIYMNANKWKKTLCFFDRHTSILLSDFFVIENSKKQRLILFSFCHPEAMGTAFRHRELIAYDVKKQKILYSSF